MARNIVIIFSLFLSPFVLANGEDAKCFCKALCLFNGDDNSDFYKVEDVSCELPVEKQKESLKAKLLKHIKSEHGVPTWEQVKSKVEIMCYHSKNQKQEKSK